MTINRLEFPYCYISSVLGVMGTAPDGLTPGAAFIVIAPAVSPWDLYENYLAVRNENGEQNVEGFNFYPPILNWPVLNQGTYGDGAGQVIIFDGTAWTPAPTYYTLPNWMTHFIKGGETVFIPQNRILFITDGFTCDGDLIIDGDMVEVD
jgi:hypothetical protein